jgi:DNA replication protein DnaC
MAMYQSEVRGTGRAWREESILKERITCLAEYLTSDDERFGFMLLGSAGNGKTTLLRAFQHLLLLLGQLPNCEENYGLKPGTYMRICRATDYVFYASNSQRYDLTIRAIRDAPLLGIDDLGQESLSLQSYGNIMFPIIDLLEYRYSRRLFTAATTNYSAKELVGKYGERLADRFREMFFRIAFNFDSLRKINSTK